jgi:hypothetical protein
LVRVSPRGEQEKTVGARNAGGTERRAPGVPAPIVGDGLARPARYNPVPAGAQA